MNFKCADCGHTFDEPVHIRDDEVIDYGIGRRWVTLFEGNVCPGCESENWTDISETEETI